MALAAAFSPRVAKPALEARIGCLRRQQSRAARSSIVPAELEKKTKTYYQDCWRLLKPTIIVGMRLDQITIEVIEGLKFSSSSSHANCALRNIETNASQSGKMRVTGLETEILVWGQAWPVFIAIQRIVLDRSFVVSVVSRYRSRS